MKKLVIGNIPFLNTLGIYENGQILISYQADINLNKFPKVET